MKRLQAISVSGGTAVGRVFILPQAQDHQPLPCLCTPAQELAAFQQACAKAKQQLFELEEKALTQAGREGADILHIHAMLLDDPDFILETQSLIQLGLPAHQAVLKAGTKFAQAFAALEDDYLSPRAADVEEVAERVSTLLIGAASDEPPREEMIVLAAHTLGPGLLLRWGKERLLGVIVQGCPPTSHTAILARAMGLPMVAGLSPQPDWQGRNAAIDADRGLVWLDPDQQILLQLREQIGRQHQNPEQLHTLAHVPAVTKDGRHATILANLSHPEQASQALSLGAEGVGLFRSEFLFLGRDAPPDEEEQYQCYRRLVEGMAGHPVVVRTLDAGSDKPLPYLNLPLEENPALGCRGLRLSLAQPELFCTQLRALLRCAAHGKLSVLFPMVTDPQEVARAKQLLAQCRRELTDRGVTIGETELGVMIETPAAALLAHQLAKEVSFFSLGTNDLTQYTLAADRGSQQPGSARHPAVLSLIQMAVEGGHAHGCRVAMCGELAGDLEMTQTLLNLGVDELSVAPSLLLPLREHIRTLSSDISST